MNQKYEKSLAYWQLSIHYLHLVQSVLEEMITQGNRWIIVTDLNENEDVNDFEVYDKLTKWSDFNLAEPLLFNFYHGLELLLKGFVLFKSQTTKLNHNIEKLQEDFLTLYPHEKTLSLLFSKYIGSSLHFQTLGQFFKDNNKTSKNFYELLRYPSDKSSTSLFSYIRLNYQESDGLVFFSEMLNDIAIIRLEATTLGRSLESHN
jgi:hypothetical protein